MSLMPWFFSTCLLLAAPQGAEQGARAVLAAQVEAWNRGDLEGYLQGYWNSSDLRFIGSRGLLKGLDAVRAHYRRGLSKPSDFGRLAFMDLKVEPLGEALLVTGTWDLQGEKPSQGRFTLVMRQIPEQGWRIVYDHSS